MQQQQQDWNEALVSRKNNQKTTQYQNLNTVGQKNRPKQKEKAMSVKEEEEIRSPENQSIDKIKNLGVNVEGRPQILYCI